LLGVIDEKHEIPHPGQGLSGLRLKSEASKLRNRIMKFGKRVTLKRM
jgi:hypothetical protein